MASALTHNIETEDVDGISLEQVEMWDTEALKDYCRKRGYKVSGTRRELASRVYCLYNDNVQEVPGAKVQAASKKRDYAGIVNYRYAATDPTRLKKWIDEDEGIKHWPPVSYLDIHWFMKAQGSVGLSREDLTAYKEGKAFSYFSCEWLKEIFYHPIKKDHLCCFLKADCMPSNRVNDAPHSLWVKVMKQSGEIVSAFCSCMAGFSQSCNHVAALLFRVNSAFKLELSTPSCTSTAAKWTKPSGSKLHLNLRLEELSLTKPRYSKGKVPSIQPKMLNSTKIRETLVMDSDTENYKEFVSALRKELPNASLFLPGTPQKVRLETSEPDIVDTENLESETDENLLAEVGMEALASKCSSTDQLLTKLAAISASSVVRVEERTSKQANSLLWKRLRIGRITASNFYRIYTKVESLKNERGTDCDSLVYSLISPATLDFLPQIAKGKSLEEPALIELAKIMCSKGHTNSHIKSCGLYIDQTRRYLGASPDGYLTCNCCGPRLVEVKCPSMPLEQLPYLDNNKKLKHKSHYYGQVQGQMLVTGIRECLFFIYYGKENDHIQFIKYDESFCEKLTANLEIFFNLYLAPKLLLGRKRKFQ